MGSRNPPLYAQKGGWADGWADRCCNNQILACTHGRCLVIEVQLLLACRHAHKGVQVGGWTDMVAWS